MEMTPSKAQGQGIGTAPTMVSSIMVPMSMEEFVKMLVDKMGQDQLEPLKEEMKGMNTRLQNIETELKIDKVRRSTPVAWKEQVKGGWKVLVGLGAVLVGMAKVFDSAVKFLRH